MAGLRPGRCYKHFERPYTRQSQRKPRKGYIKGVPGTKLNVYEVGQRKEEFTLKVNLIAKRPVQIRSNALEAVRVSVTKNLTKYLGENMFFCKILVVPHHVLRENPMATGAGADRYQSGMRQSFGKPLGTAARVMENQSILEVRALPGKYSEIKKALKIAICKLPTPCRIVAENN